MKIDGYRTSNILNTETMKTSFGVKVKIKGKWMPAGDNDGMFLFDTLAGAKQKIKEIKEAQSNE